MWRIFEEIDSSARIERHEGTPLGQLPRHPQHCPAFGRGRRARQRCNGQKAAQKLVDPQVARGALAAHRMPAPKAWAEAHRPMAPCAAWRGVAFAVTTEDARSRAGYRTVRQGQTNPAFMAYNDPVRGCGSDRVP